MLFCHWDIVWSISYLQHPNFGPCWCSHNLRQNIFSFTASIYCMRQYNNLIGVLSMLNASCVSWFSCNSWLRLYLVLNSYANLLWICYLYGIMWLMDSFICILHHFYLPRNANVVHQLVCCKSCVLIWIRWPFIYEKVNHGEKADLLLQESSIAAIFLAHTQ